MIGNYSSSPVNRKVWEHSNGAYLLTVTGLLETGEYSIEVVEEGEDYKTLKFKDKEGE